MGTVNVLRETVHIQLGPLMIIEVALGIVLGVLMLRFLPLLVAAGVAVLVLTCVGTLIAFKLGQR